MKRELAKELLLCIANHSLPLADPVPSCSFVARIGERISEYDYFEVKIRVGQWVCAVPFAKTPKANANTRKL